MSVFKSNNSSKLSDFSSNELHQYQRPNNSLRVNPLAFQSLKNLDIDKLEDDLAKEIQKKKAYEDREKVYFTNTSVILRKFSTKMINSKK
jgi:hypothetical protein